jgi:guanine deaminase
VSPSDFMRRAILLSRERMAAGDGGPFGAVIVKDGRIVAEGWNRVLGSVDPTAHAEIVAIREACRVLGEVHLEGCEIYTSCEPCPMCLAAIYWAHIGKVWYGNSREDAARIGFDDAHIYEELARPPALRRIPLERLLEEEARAAFDAWLHVPGRAPY